MKPVHITERSLKGYTTKILVSFAAVWIVPLIVLLATFRWHLPAVGVRLLYKSTWVLFAGALLSWFPISFAKLPDKTLKKWAILLGSLAAASLFLLPFGMGHWDYYGSYYGFCLNPSWYYVDNLFLSFLLHLFPVGLVFGLTDEGTAGSLSDSSSWQTDYDQSKMTGTGSGSWGGRSWLDGVWKGGQISDDFYGKHGEFDRNDESRRVSEDMQQFHSSHPGADLSDHYFWDDTLDAETDGYLDD